MDLFLLLFLLFLFIGEIKLIYKEEFECMVLLLLFIFKLFLLVEDSSALFFVEIIFFLLTWANNGKKFKLTV